MMMTTEKMSRCLGYINPRGDVVVSCAGRRSKDWGKVRDFDIILLPAAAL
jgi:hypothetical protein